MNTVFETGLSKDILDVRFDENIAIAEFGKDLFHVISDLDKNGRIITAFNQINEMKDIDALVVLNDKESWNEQFYTDFLQEISGMDFEKEDVKIEKFAQHLTRSREIIFLQRIIMSLLNSTKITIAAVNGEIVTPAFGAMLAFDMRFMYEDAKFSMAHSKFGLHPSGALPLFLQKYLGHGKAVEILMKGGVINAKKAKDLGLITEIISENDSIEEYSVKSAKEIARGIKYSIKTTKVLSFNFIDELKHYFEIESRLIM